MIPGELLCIHDSPSFILPYSQGSIYLLTKRVIIVILFSSFKKQGNVYLELNNRDWGKSKLCTARDELPDMLPLIQRS